jgi:hypothetical protein
MDDADDFLAQMRSKLAGVAAQSEAAQVQMAMVQNVRAAMVRGPEDPACIFGTGASM